MHEYPHTAIDYYEKIWDNKDVKEINNEYIFLLFNRNEEELNELKDICEESSEFVSMVKEVNKKHRGYLTVAEDELRIKNSLISEAREEAIKTNQEKIVLNMLKENIPVEQIAKITNLSIDEINKIIDSK